MAKPIKETPIIFGEDAKRFNQSIKDVKPASDDEKRRIKEAYENISFIHYITENLKLSMLPV